MEDFNQNPDQNQDKDKENQEIQGSEQPQKDHEIKPLISPIGAAFIGLIGGFFLYQIVGGLLTVIIFGFDIKHAPVDGMRLMTMAGQILFILLPALLFSKWFYEDVSYIIRTKFPKWAEVGWFVLGLIVLTPLLQNYIYIQNFVLIKLADKIPIIQSAKNLMDKLDKLVEGQYASLLTAHSFFEGVFVIIIVAVVPALCEETMFRGFIQRSFEFRIKPVWAAFFTAIFFGLYHFNPYGLIPLIGLGFYFGYAAYTSDSIFVPMTLHFLNNFSAIIVFYMFGSDELLNSSIDKNINIVSTLITFVGLLILFIGVIILIKKFYKQKSVKTGGNQNAGMS